MVAARPGQGVERAAPALSPDLLTGLLQGGRLGCEAVPAALLETDLVLETGGGEVESAVLSGRARHTEWCSAAEWARLVTAGWGEQSPTVPQRCHGCPVRLAPGRPGPPARPAPVPARPPLQSAQP